MKKSYFLMAAAAAMFAACSETEMVNVVNEAEAQKAIGFETFSYKSTRQVVSNNLNDYYTNFSVFGWEGATAIFKNTEVTYDAPAWEYDPAKTKYWNAAATYQFFAVAPYNAEVTCTDAGVIGIPAAASATAAKENLQTTFGDLNTGQFGSDKDWLKAARQDYQMANGTTVEFTFSHMMSKLAVAISKSGNEQIVVKSVTITDANNKLHNAATYDGSVWTGTAQEAELEGVVGTMKEVAPKSYYTMEYLIVPTAENANSLKFHITYRITGESTDRVVDADVTGITNFEPGYSYTLTANIGAAPIKFTAVAVTDWSKDTDDVTITQ